MKHYWIGLSLISLFFLGACGRAESNEPAKLSQTVIKDQATFEREFDTPTLMTDYTFITPTEIIMRAHKAAGGMTWTRPKSLSMAGYAVFYKNGQSVRHESHKMWRIYETAKTNAHQVDGKVRIYSVKNGETVINISYDGYRTYTDEGVQPKTISDKSWSSNFGFGVIRHALDKGYRLERLPDDLIDGKPAFIIKVIDPEGGDTQFGISHNDYKVLKVGFQTSRGWHERIYSDFYSNPDDEWVQPGRVRLYYNGVKSNEVIWKTYTINHDLPDCLFILPQSQNCAS